MNEENAWEKVDAAMVEGPVEKSVREVREESERSHQENETGKGCRAL